MSALDLLPDPADEPTAPDRYMALHTFSSTEEGDLPFNKGDIIVATKTEGDWWMGRLEANGLSGTVGSFPANYVQLTLDAAEAVLPHEKPTETNLKAIHDFHSDEDGDLRFSKGDTLIGTELQGDWWTGRHAVTGAVGAFPTNYVHEDTGDDTSDATAATTAAAESENTTAGDADTPRTRLIALHDFPSEEDGDLQFKKGDILWGIKLEDQWWSGNHDRTGEMGAFPANYTREEKLEDATTTPEVETTSASSAAAPTSAKTKSTDNASNASKKTAVELKEEQEEQEIAALRIQSVSRGKKARNKVNRKRTAVKEETAALKIETTYRGNQARKKVKKQRNKIKEKVTKEDDTTSEKQADAAIKIQSLQRGHTSRKDARKKMTGVKRSKKKRARTDSDSSTNGNSSGAESIPERSDGVDWDGDGVIDDDVVILPAKVSITRIELEVLFDLWDTDGDEVLTMKEFQQAMKQPKEVEKLPQLQIARINRVVEKAEEDEQNVEWQYWDKDDFVTVLQTPASSPPENMSKKEKKRFKSQQRRWAPKLIKSENADGTITHRHGKGSLALTKDEFIERYHSIKEWTAAQVRVNPSQAKKRRDKLHKQASSKSGGNSMLSVEDLEQIRIRLRQKCTTHNGVDVAQILKRRRWPVDRGTLDEQGNPIKLKVKYETMKDACQSALQSRLGTDEKFAGFWAYLQTEEKEKVSYVEFRRFVEYVSRNRARRKKSIVTGNAEVIANFSQGFRPDNNTKSQAFVGEKNVAKINPVLVAFRDMLIESSWKEELLRDHFHVFDKDGDGTITRKEFRIGFESLSIPHTKKDLELIIQVLDKNHDDVIDYEEFTTQIFEDPEQILAELASQKAEEKKLLLEAEKKKELEANVATSAGPVEVSDQNLMSIDDLEQIRIRLRQKCTTFRGIDVSEAFPHRKWPGVGDLGLVNYVEMRTHMQFLYPKRLGGPNNDWAFPSFWVYLNIEDEQQGGCSKDEFTRFVSFVAEDSKTGKRTRRRKSVATGHAAVVHNFSDGFRPDTNSSAEVSKANAKKSQDKEKLQENQAKRVRIQETKESWESAEKPRSPLVKSILKTEPDTDGKANQQSLVANLKAASFSKKLMNAKFARKIGDNTLDDDEVKMIKKKIKAASYKKGGADLTKLFDEWDKDKNKHLDYAELATAVARLLPKNQMLSRIEMEQLCKKFDIDGNGLISVDEFKAFLKIEYVSKRKKRSELDSKEFLSQASMVGSVTAGFRGALPKQKEKSKTKLPKLKKAQWRTMRDENSEEKSNGDASSTPNSPALGPADSPSPSPSPIDRKTEDDGKNDSDDILSGSDDEWDGGGYDANGRKIPKRLVRRKRIQSNTTTELDEALKTIPQERVEPIQSSEVYDGGQQNDGNWFVDSDSEDELILLEGEMTAPRHTAPRMTPLMRSRKNKMDSSIIQQYATSWDEPISSSGGIKSIPSSFGKSTRASGTFPISTTRAREDQSKWFDETDNGAKHLLDQGDGDIDVTLYRRQWDDRQPGDGSEANPWRVAVKTSWTGEIAAPSWPTKQGTWVYVPNPPKKYKLSHHEISLNRAFGRGKDDVEVAAAAAAAADETKDSPRQKRLRRKNKNKKGKEEEIHQKSTVVYHPMQRLAKKNATGASQPWNSRIELSVPERPPTHNPEWERKLQNEPQAQFPPLSVSLPL